MLAQIHLLDDRQLCTILYNCVSPRTWICAKEAREWNRSSALEAYLIFVTNITNLIWKLEPKIVSVEKMDKY